MSEAGTDKKTERAHFFTTYMSVCTYPRTRVLYINMNARGVLKSHQFYVCTGVQKEHDVMSKSISHRHSFFIPIAQSL